MAQARSDLAERAWHIDVLERVGKGVRSRSQSRPLCRLVRGIRCRFPTLSVRTNCPRELIALVAQVRPGAQLRRKLTLVVVQSWIGQNLRGNLRKVRLQPQVGPNTLCRPVVARNLMAAVAS